MKSRNTHWVAVLALAFAACGTDGPAALPIDPDPEPPKPGPGVVLGMVSGDQQTGRAGRQLAERLVVRVTDAHGVGIPNVSVTWTVTAGEGALNGRWQECPLAENQFGDPETAISTLTDQSGFARVSFMPTWFGPVKVAASSAGIPGSPVTFTTDASDPGARIELVSGNNQQGVAGAWAGGNDLTVRILDGHGDGVLHVPVKWRIKSGIGVLRVHSGCSGGRVGGDNLVTRTGTYLSPAGEGYTSLTFSPTTVGVSSVAVSVPGVDGSGAVFAVNTNRVLIGLSVDPWSGGPGFVGPGWKADVTVPAGTIVEFFNDNGSARIASITAPDGGTPFDSGSLKTGEVFQFIPNVAGTWNYVDQVSGAAGKLIVQ